jgi:hypothetical protein
MLGVNMGKKILFCILCVAIFLMAWFFLRNTNNPRQQAVITLQSLNTALADPNASRDLLNIVALPSGIKDRTREEQNEFLRKALLDEVSIEGVNDLRKHGTYGPLTTLFPTEAATWASQAGVDKLSCVAFRMVKNGVTAEVVIATNGAPKVVRCNNVKQMAL